MLACSASSRPSARGRGARRSRETHRRERKRSSHAGDRKWFRDRGGGHRGGGRARDQELVITAGRSRTTDRTSQTHFGIDYGHLLDSLGHQLRHIAGLSWWPLYALPLVAIVMLAASWMVAIVTRRSGLRDRVVAVLADDTAMAALGAYAIAALNFTLAVLVDHVRLNDYDSRYLTLTNTFGPICRHVDALPGDPLAGRAHRAFRRACSRSSRSPASWRS